MRSPTLSRTVRSNCRSSAAWPEELTTWQWKPWAAISRARRARRSGRRPVRRTASGIRRRYSPPSSRHTGWPTVRPIRSQQAISTAARSGGWPAPPACAAPRCRRRCVRPAPAGGRRGGPTTRPAARPPPPLPIPPAPQSVVSRTSSERTGCAAVVQPTSTRWNSRSLIFMRDIPCCEAAGGSRKPISSRKSVHGSTTASKRLHSKAMHSWTTSSGALAPAVISTVSSPENQAGSMSAGPSIRCDGRPPWRAISASRRLLELFRLPTTSTTSACRDKVRTTSCRFCVA